MVVDMSTLSEPVFITHCQHLALFSVTGADARSFLQSQLTQDVSKITPRQAALAGFCTAQGRLWANMLLTETNPDDAIVGVASADLLESFLKRLRMFVLRSKVTISPVADRMILGVELEPAALAAMSAQLGCELPQEPFASADTASGCWIRVPADQDAMARLLWLANEQQYAQVLLAIGEHAMVLSESNAWRVNDIKAGLAWVHAATQDLFIAQTLNLDLIGGVSFTKGCYPGQEVIARAHYRGTVKRRMHLASVVGQAQDLQAGMDVFEVNEPDNPVGRLINIASEHSSPDAASERQWALFEAPFKTLEGPALRAGSPTGPELHVQALPYELQPQ